jgi:hypothetical protein
VGAGELHVGLHERLEDPLQVVGRDADAGVLHAHVDPRPGAGEPRAGDACVAVPALTVMRPGSARRPAVGGDALARRR